MIRVVIALALLACLLAGCGGSGHKQVISRQEVTTYVDANVPDVSRLYAVFAAQRPDISLETICTAMDADGREYTCNVNATEKGGYSVALLSLDVICDAESCTYQETDY